MNCNCISDLGEKLTERFTEQLGVEASVTCENEGFLFGKSSASQALFTNFKVTAQAKGYTRGKVIPVSANYCPFCGKSAKEEVAK